jgi:hypothetical protein
MARAVENPDRDFSTKGHAEEDLGTLRYALEHDAPALPYNEAAKVRIGKLIARPFSRRVHW